MDTRTANWSYNDTNRLIAIWREHQNQLTSCSNTASIYIEIRSKLLENGTNRSIDQVKKKIAQLKQTYRKESKSSMKTGASPSTWPHFNDVHEIMHQSHFFNAEHDLTSESLEPANKPQKRKCRTNKKTKLVQKVEEIIQNENEFNQQIVSALQDFKKKQTEDDNFKTSVLETLHKLNSKIDSVLSFNNPIPQNPFVPNTIVQNSYNHNQSSLNTFYPLTPSNSFNTHAISSSPVIPYENPPSSSNQFNHSFTSIPSSTISSTDPNYAII